MVKNPLCNAGDVGLIPGRGTKIPSAVEQLSPYTTTTELSCSGIHEPQLSGLCATRNDAACKTPRSTMAR